MSFRPLAIALFVALAGSCSPAVAEHGAHKDTAPTPANPHAAHSAASRPAPSGYAAVEVDTERLKALGLATTRVEHASLVRELRSVGVLALDETRTAHVHAKVRGVIEGVQADFVGKPVKRGQSLCAIYSQPVLAAELELISLLKQRRATASTAPSVLGDLEQSYDALVDASKKRLLLWDVPRGEVDRLEKTMEPSRTFTLSSPATGTIVAKQAYVGSYVEPGTELYVVSNLSKLWALVDIYEQDVPFIAIGQAARIRVSGAGEPLTGKVSFLPPTIDESTRTLKARLDVENRDGSLRPGAFLDVEMSLPIGHGLVVPESAVIRTGNRSLVYVVHGSHIEPREIRIGPTVNRLIRVDQGLEEGELVATGAQFLIDSESRLRASSAPGGAHVH
jgi:membrane fusion protein, copper/silver efflux system